MGLANAEVKLNFQCDQGIKHENLMGQDLDAGESTGDYVVSPPWTRMGYVGLGWGFDNFGGQFPRAELRVKTWSSPVQYSPLDLHIEAHTSVP